MSHYLKLPALFSLLLLLASCSSQNLVDDFEFDYASAKLSDFDGKWEARVKCQGGSWHPYAEVKIKNGVGRLYNYGNYGKSTTAELDTMTGEIRWEGKYDNRSGNKYARYSVNGQWLKDKFYITGKRGPKTCRGLLRQEKKTRIGDRLNREEVMQHLAGRTEKWTKGAAYYSPDGKLEAVWLGSRLSGKWQVSRSGRVCFTLSSWEKDCHYYIEEDGKVVLVWKYQKRGAREMWDGDRLSDFVN